MKWLVVFAVFFAGLFLVKETQRAEEGVYRELVRARNGAGRVR